MPMQKNRFSMRHTDSAFPWNLYIFVFSFLIYGVSGFADPEIEPRHGSIDWLASMGDDSDRLRALGKGTILLLCNEGYDAASLAGVFVDEDESSVGSRWVRLEWPDEPRARAGDAQRFLEQADRYEVRRLPAVLLFDASGRAYARIESEGLVGDQVSESIRRAGATLADRDRALREADASMGLQRAQALDRALACVESFVLTDYESLAREIITLDESGEAGVAHKYEAIFAERDLDEFIQGTVYPLIDQGGYAEARMALQGVLGDWPLSTDQRQLLLGFQAQLHYSEGDRELALAAIDRAIAVDPNSDASAKLFTAKEQIRMMPLPDVPGASAPVSH